MTAAEFRAYSVPEHLMSPVARLASALDLARDSFGDVVPPMIYVHALKVVETPALDGIELVQRDQVGRFGSWFPTTEARPCGQSPPIVGTRRATTT